MWAIFEILKFLCLFSNLQVLTLYFSSRLDKTGDFSYFPANFYSWESEMSQSKLGFKRHFITFLTAVNLFFSPHMFASQAESASKSEKKLSSSPISDFIWKRIPNRNEIIADVGLQTPIDMLIGCYVDLGKNPIAKAVVRDISKLPSAILKAFQGTQVGGTEFSFDRSNVYSQIVKVGVKVGGIHYLSNHFHVDAEKAALLSNFPGDCAARSLVKVGMDSQIANSTLPIEAFFFQEFDPSWGYNAVAEVAPKLALVSFIGAGIKKLKIGENIKKTVVYGFNAGHRFITPASKLVFNQKQNMKVNAEGFVKHGYSRYSSYTYSAAVAMTAIFFEQLVTTYIMAPVGRITQDTMMLSLENPTLVIPFIVNTLSSSKEAAILLFFYIYDESSKWMNSEPASSSVVESDVDEKDEL